MAAKKKRKSKKYAAVVALAGGGKVTKKQAKTHLSDFIESIDGEILWVIPIGVDMAKSLDMVVNFLWEEEARYILVTDEEGADKDWVSNAESVVEADDDIYESAIAEASSASSDDKRLIIILDEELESDVELVETAMDEGLTCYDLASGLVQLSEVVEEDDDEEEDDEPEDDDEPEEDEEEEDDDVELPPKTQKLFDKGNVDGAAEKLAEELDSNEVRKLADKVGVKYGKGVWAKTIAKDIIEKLAYEEEPEEEEEPEPEEKPKPKKRSPKKKEAEEPEEPRLDQSDPEDAAFDADRYMRSDVIHAAASVAGNKSVAEAGKFIEMLKKHGLL